MNTLQHYSIKYLTLLTNITFTSAMLLMIYVAYQLFYPFIPIEFYDEKYPVLTPVVERGGHLAYKLRGKKYVNLTASLTRQLFCHDQDTLEVIGLDPAYSTSPPVEFDHVVQVPIPLNMHPGVCILRETGTFKYSVFREVTLSMESEQFEIK